MEFFSKEENLNLLSETDLTKLLASVGINNYKIFNISLLGFKSNLIIIVQTEQ